MGLPPRTGSVFVIDGDVSGAFSTDGAGLRGGFTDEPALEVTYLAEGFDQMVFKGAVVRPGSVVLRTD